MFWLEQNNSEKYKYVFEYSVGTYYDAFIFQLLINKEITINVPVANRYVDILLKCVLNKVSYKIEMYGNIRGHGNTETVKWGACI